MKTLLVFLAMSSMLMARDGKPAPDSRTPLLPPPAKSPDPAPAASPATPTSGEAARSIRDVDGRTIQAEPVKIVDGQLRVNFEGKYVEIPLERINADDLKEIVASLAAKNAAFKILSVMDDGRALAILFLTKSYAGNKILTSTEKTVALTNVSEIAAEDFVEGTAIEVEIQSVNGDKLRGWKMVTITKPAGAKINNK